MAKPITINELYKELSVAIKMGYGDKKILLADDDEGNGYHPMYYAVTPMKDFDEESLSYCNLYGVSVEDAKKNYVILG